MGAQGKQRKGRREAANTLRGHARTEPEISETENTATGRATRAADLPGRCSHLLLILSKSCSPVYDRVHMMVSLNNVLWFCRIEKS